MLDKNLNIIKQRWPHIAEILCNCNMPKLVQLEDRGPESTLVIDGIHLTSTYDRTLEAERQVKLIPDWSENAWVYGVGLGDIPLNLLQREKIKKLSVVILNPSVTLASLSYYDHSTWLSDPRVELVSGTDDNLAAPLVANPACLILADNKSASLRDRVFLELATPFINKKYAAKNPDIINAIAKNESYAIKDGDVNSLFKSKVDSIILVAAAGPSLTENIKKIKSNRKSFYIIAVNSALKPLANNDIIPDIAIVVDSDDKIISCFEGYDLTLYTNVPLVYFPIIPESILSVWTGSRLMAYSTHSTYENIRQKHPKGTLFSSGSVLHCAVDLAVQMGAAKIILVGADLAYPGGVKYAKGAGWKEKESVGKQHWVLDGHGNKIDTNPAFRGYLRDLETYIKQHPDVIFYNSSLDGAHIDGTKLWENVLQ